MRYALLFLILLANSIEIHACLGARQTRILPLGMVGDEVVAMYIKMNRTENPPENAKDQDEMGWWYGTAELIEFNINSYQITCRYKAQEFAWSMAKLEAPLDKLYQTFYKGAQNIAGFKQFKPISISICDFAMDCKLAALSYADSSKALINFKPQNKLIDVSGLDFTDSTMVTYYLGAHDDANYHATKLRLSGYGDGYGIGSTRLYELDGKYLLVLHMGIGYWGELTDGSIPCPEPEFTPAHPKFDKIENCTYDEPILHHGTGLDLPIWIN